MKQNVIMVLHNGAKKLCLFSPRCAQYGMSSSKPNKDNIRLDEEVKQNSSSQGCLKLSVSGSKKIFALIQHLLNVYQGEYDLLTCLMRAHVIATEAMGPYTCCYHHYSSATRHVHGVVDRAQQHQKLFLTLGS